MHSSVAEHRIANPGVAGAIPAAPFLFFSYYNCSDQPVQLDRKNNINAWWGDKMCDPRGNRTLNLRIWNPTRYQLRHGVKRVRILYFGVLK